MAKNKPSNKFKFKNGSEIHLDPAGGEQLKGMTPPSGFSDLEEKSDPGVEAGEALTQLNEMGLPILPDLSSMKIEVEMTKVEPVEELPLVTSFAIQKIKDSFFLVTMQSRGKKIIDIKYGESNPSWGHTLDEFKMAIVQEYDRYFSGKE